MKKLPNILFRKKCSSAKNFSLLFNDNLESKQSSVDLRHINCVAHKLPFCRSNYLTVSETQGLRQYLKHNYDLMADLTLVQPQIASICSFGIHLEVPQVSV